ncbi:hydrogenase [Desulfovibrio aerotolerans]|uniref:Hydrogenase n=1 Tax=Solidesulfovibrio aerotolerans TaxID=295255 RepID=A0A7C9IUK5_9BACT|nr:4Fe-4S dicluster domain-containing protein [Solidesulfovibrio aerotolerans]MYL83740.1 hydrogenase [Solidesulfovibrio aerotolerans]
MAAVKYISREKLPEWLKALAAERRLLVPVEEGGAVVFRAYDPAKAPVFGSDATAPPKGSVFPASKELFSYTYGKEGEDAKPTLTLDPKTTAEPTVVFGSKPCGARGFLIFDRVYMGKKFPDPYYIAAREATVFVTMACDTVENTCFCHWVGSGPADPAGSDLLLTPVAGGWLVEAVSAKGEPLLASPALTDGAAKAAEAEEVKAKTRAALGEAPDISTSKEALLARFDDMDFWRDQSDKCISCGACTYLCPTCYCFSITDEGSGMSGKRLRSWDACMHFQFTLEASGHNPRPTKAHRLKNRVGHKFSYYPTLHDGLIACCGCGRCVKSCPVSVDIREIVQNAVAKAKA